MLGRFLRVPRKRCVFKSFRGPTTPQPRWRAQVRWQARRGENAQKSDLWCEFCRRKGRRPWLVPPVIPVFGTWHAGCSCLGSTTWLGLVPPQTTHLILRVGRGSLEDTGANFKTAAVFGQSKRAVMDFHHGPFAFCAPYSGYRPVMQPKQNASPPTARCSPARLR